jgi:hypothetical protein
MRTVGGMAGEVMRNRVIRVPDPLWEAAQERADQREETLSGVIRNFLQRYTQGPNPRHLYDMTTFADLGPATKAQVAAGKLSEDLEEGRQTWMGNPNVIAGTRGQFVVDRDGDLVNYGLMMTYEPGWRAVFVAEAGWRP